MLLYRVNDFMYSCTELLRGGFRVNLKISIRIKIFLIEFPAIVLHRINDTPIYPSSSFPDTLRRPLMRETAHRYSEIFLRQSIRSLSKESANFLFIRFSRHLAEFIRFALSTSSKPRIFSLKLPQKYRITKEIVDLLHQLVVQEDGGGDFLAADFPERFLHLFSFFIIHCFEATESPIKFLR